MSGREAESPGRQAADAADNEAILAKRAFYAQEQVANTYDEQRFGGASGGHVSIREIETILTCLPAAGVVADIACGSGRLTARLRATGMTTIGIDQSKPMLTTAFRQHGGPWVQGDAYHLPLADGQLDAVTALRLLFHFADLMPLLREFRRVVHVGGYLACDTYDWSLRALAPLGKQRWGDRVYTIRHEEFRRVAEQAGWQVVSAKRGFLFSPYLYRRLPLPLVRRLERLESLAPERFLCRTFWSLQAR